LRGQAWEEISSVFLLACVCPYPVDSKLEGTEKRSCLTLYSMGCFHAFRAAHIIGLNPSIA
jgi:hypothetical protein